MTYLPILLLTGYLGSGKTTLLNRILNNRRGIRFAVIVNDIGEVNIDADLIERGGVVGGSDQSLVALQNGCICCSLQSDLIKQIDDIIAMKRFDYLVIEASGICEPAPIARTICTMPFIDESYSRTVMPRLDCICTVVDSRRMIDEFIDALSGADNQSDTPADLTRLVVEQIEFCNIILLNKASEVTPEEMNLLRSIISGLQPHAKMIECDYADVDLSQILDTHLFNFERVAESATWIHQLERPGDEIEKENEHHHHEHEHEPEHHHDHDCCCGHDHEHDHDCCGHDHEHEHDHDCCRHDHDHHHGHVHHGVSTYVYYRRAPFDLNKFDRMVGTEWPRNIIRAKGVCWFRQNPDMTYIFEQAGRLKNVSEAGQWYATAPEEELRQIMIAEPGLVRDWDDNYGDRMQKIVFIGRDLDPAAIDAALDPCLDPTYRLP